MALSHNELAFRFRRVTVGAQRLVWARRKLKHETITPEGRFYEVQSMALMAHASF